ncbi:MAG: hypothetical protein A3D92_19635 [Bacteroidetes bacterium RIFCSPHIGHO2_02_FULL_44_7]|nr:MAG: hypothetical protein A3D92_19635 [Bacteroidetes bacterium RIFCSPHIGHO2_02_FULL_44_7]
MKPVLLIRGIISAAFLVLIAMNIELAKVFVSLRSFSLPLLLLFFIPFFLTTIFNTFSLDILLRALRYRIPFKELLRIKFTSRSIGLFFPSQVGELSLLPLLKIKQIPFGASLAVFLTDKLISFLVLMAFALYGILTFFTQNAFWNGIFVFLTVLGGIMFCIQSQFIRGLVKKYILRKYSSLFSGFYEYVTLLGKNGSALSMDFFLTLTWIFSTSVIIYFLFSRFQYTIPILTIIAIQAIGSLSVLIPISISGIGIRESLTIFLYTLYGVDPSLSGAIFLLFLFVSYIIGGIILLLTAKDFNVATLKTMIHDENTY